MSRAVDTLMLEHRFIERMLGSLATFARRLQQDDAADPGESARRQVAQYARFFREFADRCHHGKEEARLFVAMERYGFGPHEGPVAVMLYEHELGRGFVRRLAEIGGGVGALSISERQEIAAIGEQYGSLLGHHIQKEDNILFPMAMQALPLSVQKQLHEEFEAFERDEMGEGVHEELHGMAEALLKAYPPRIVGFAMHAGHGFGQNR
jgi:hemerythrin-like domain-containing protein